MSLLENLLTQEAFWAFVSMLLTAAFGFLWKFLRKKSLEEAAVDALRDGVQLTQDRFVVFAKRAAEDGKLSKEEREAARQMAIEEALALAKGPVKDLLLSWGLPKLQALVGRIVQGSK